VILNSSELTETCDYDALLSESSIRLLDLQASSNDKILTTLHTHSLNNAPTFRALSYTWGKPYRNVRVENIESPPEFVARISCNGKQVAVTQNPFDALSAFLNLGITRYLWVDAVCINQVDLEERGSQVTLMGDIYSKAHRRI
jgi:hypothetical protein